MLPSPHLRKVMTISISISCRVCFCLTILYQQILTPSQDFVFFAISVNCKMHRIYEKILKNCLAKILNISRYHKRSHQNWKKYHLSSCMQAFFCFKIHSSLICFSGKNREKTLKTIHSIRSNKYSHHITVDKFRLIILLISILPSLRSRWAFTDTKCNYTKKQKITGEFHFPFIFKQFYKTSTVLW